MYVLLENYDTRGPRVTSAGSSQSRRMAGYYSGVKQAVLQPEQITVILPKLMIYGCFVKTISLHQVWLCICNHPRVNWLFIVNLASGDSSAFNIHISIYYSCLQNLIFITIWLVLYYYFFYACNSSMFYIFNLWQLLYMW